MTLWLMLALAAFVIIVAGGSLWRKRKGGRD